jgi:hypothetical protein
LPQFVQISILSSLTRWCCTWRQFMHSTSRVAPCIHFGACNVGTPYRFFVAGTTGTTLHTVSRLLSAWEDEGLVAGGRQRVTVTDPHALMLIAENRRKK